METIKLSQTVEKSIQDFYNKNDFGEEGGINESYAWIKFGFFSIPIPNFESRKNNVYFHDISHIVTENDTNWKGESAVSAWEVASGGWKKLIIPWLLTLWAMGLGIIFYRKSTLNAFKKGLTMNNAIVSGITKDEMNELSVAELRNVLSNKPKRNTNSTIWSLISLVVFIFPFAIGIAIAVFLLKLF